MSKILLKPGQFRLLLAGMVLLSHLSALSTGRLGVILFFVLSGYWISDLWERQSSDPVAKRLFFLNRFLRVWPIYFLVVIAACALLDHPLHLASVTIFGVASSSGVRPLGVEWSLDIEAQFYLLLPLLATIRPSGWLIVPATVGGWLVWRFTGVNNVFMYLPAFGAGMLCYQRRALPLAVSWQKALAAFVVLTAALALTPAGRAMLDTKIPDVINRDIFAMIWGVPLVFYVAASLRLKSGPLDRHLGNLSFPLYLVQEPVIQLMRLAGITSKPALVAVACGVALTLYAALDVPLENMRHTLLNSLKRRLTARPLKTAVLDDVPVESLQPLS